MKEKQISILSEVFTVKNNTQNLEYIPTGKQDIWEAYERPSREKVYIWTYWEDWFGKLGSGKFQVRSYNTFQFTIDGEIEFEGDKYYVLITKCRRELYKI